MNNVTVAKDRFPTVIGAFVYENRAPTNREVDLMARDMARRIGESQIAPMPNDYEHAIVDGNYWRALRIPRGAFIIGKPHKKAHTCFVKYGKISIYSTVDGVAHLTTGDVFPASANSRKVGIAEEDTMFITCTPVDTFDILEAEQEFVE